MRISILALVLPVLGGSIPAAQTARGIREGPVLYFFFSPDAPGGSPAARKALEFTKAHGNRLRPVVLIDRFRGLGKLEESSPFYRTLKELQSQGALNLPLYDPEGLALAESWQLRSLPAFVLVSGGQAHVTLGSGGSLDGLWECSQ
jgi:hypothetical protein